MRILSIDVGMKHLAFCVFVIKNTKHYTVEKWDVIGIGGLSSMYEDIKKLILICRKLNKS